LQQSGELLLMPDWTGMTPLSSLAKAREDANESVLPHLKKGALQNAL
jgi:hypothetical protein